MGAEPSSRLNGQLPDGWMPISHLETFNAISEVCVTAICDRDEEKLNKYQQLYKVPNIYSNYQELINLEKPDIISIATRTEARPEIIKYACNNGVKGVYFEKPICRSIIDTREILYTAKKRNVILGYGVNRRYHAAYKKAKELIINGEIGTLREMQIEHGVSTLYWTHPHSIDLMLFFANNCEIDFIQADCVFTNNYIHTNNNFIDNDPIVNMAFVKFCNGFTARINTGIGLNTNLVGTKGVIKILANGSKLHLHKIGQSPYIMEHEEVPFKISDGATVTSFKDMINAIKNGITEANISENEILVGMQILQGIMHSSLKNGQRVTLSEIPETMIITGKIGELYA